MTALHLVRAPVAVSALARWAGERGWIRGRSAAFDEGRALHHLLNEMFGPAALRPFRLLVPPRRDRGNLYGYSARDADELSAGARNHALPDHLDVLSPERLRSKPVPGNWRAGQRLGFDLRARPVRRVDKTLGEPPNEIGKGREIDAFLLEALRGHARVRDGMEREGRSREAVYLDWLEHRLAPAAELDRAASRLARFRRARVARDKSGPEGPDATVHGALTVTDPTAFSRLLAKGVGRHCAYGYGMLLLRPPNLPAPER